MANHNLILVNQKINIWQNEIGPLNSLWNRKIAHVFFLFVINRIKIDFFLLYKRKARETIE